MTSFLHHLSRNRSSIATSQQIPFTPVTEYPADSAHRPANGLPVSAHEKPFVRELSSLLGPVPASLTLSDFDRRMRGAENENVEALRDELHSALADPAGKALGVTPYLWLVFRFGQEEFLYLDGLLPRDDRRREVLAVAEKARKMSWSIGGSPEPPIDPFETKRETYYRNLHLLLRHGADQGDLFSIDALLARYRTQRRGADTAAQSQADQNRYALCPVTTRGAEFSGYDRLFSDSPPPTDGRIYHSFILQTPLGFALCRDGNPLAVVSCAARTPDRLEVVQLQGVNPRTACKDSVTGMIRPRTMPQHALQSLRVWPFLIECMCQYATIHRFRYVEILPAARNPWTKRGSDGEPPHLALDRAEKIYDATAQMLGFGRDPRSDRWQLELPHCRSPVTHASPTVTRRNDP